MTALPIGNTEGPRLEFKRGDGLKLEAVATSIVSFLNAKGGVLWLGIETDGERATALRALDDPIGWKRRIEDHLADVLRPPGSAGDVDVEVLDKEGLLRISCEPKEGRKPYACQRERRFSFPIREGARCRPLTWTEIRDLFRHSGEQVARIEEELQKRISKQQASWLKDTGLESRGFCLATVPADRMDVDLSNRAIREQLGPSTTRASYYRISGALLGEPKLDKDSYGERLVITAPRIGELSVYRDGVIRFASPIRRLMPPLSSSDMVHPFVLIGLVASFLSRSVELLSLAGAATGARVDSCAWFRSPRDLLLHAGSPREVLYGFPEARRVGRLPADELHEFSIDWPPWPEPGTDPDALAYRLVKRIYEGFGLFEEDIPREFDRTTKRLTLPE